MRGEDGYQFIEVDAKGRRRSILSSDDLFAGIKNKSAVAGHNIRLTIDRDMQIEAYKKLNERPGSVCGRGYPHW